jgi:predicted RNase H-like nuclease (RuvC/YqgF family)
MQVGLVENIGGVLAQNNQQVLEKLDKAGVAFENFINEARKQMEAQKTETAALVGRIAELEKEKKILEDTHKKEVKALQGTIGTLTQALQRLETKVTQIEAKHDGHIHHVGLPNIQVANGITVLSCWTAKNTADEVAKRRK